MTAKLDGGTSNVDVAQVFSLSSRPARGPLVINDIAYVICAHEVLRGCNRLIIVEGLDHTTHSSEILLTVVVRRPGLKSDIFLQN